MTRVALAIGVGALMSMACPVAAQDSEAEIAPGTTSAATSAAAGRRPPLTGRALVYLEADEDVDEFSRIFVYEVIAGRLRDLGLAVVRGDASASERPPMTCLSDPGCVRGLQRDHTAPLVLAFRLAGAAEELVVTWRRSDAVAEEPSRIEADENGVASALGQVLMELELGRVPCVVVVESGLAVTLSVDGVALQIPGLVASGDHRAHTTAAGRDAWSGPLRCAGGRVLRVRVR